MLREAVDLVLDGGLAKPTLEGSSSNIGAKACIFSTGRVRIDKFG